MSEKNHTITIPMREYIELLRTKVSSADTSGLNGATPKERPAHSWTGKDEQAKIIRLHQLGYRVGEISKVVGRSPTTVRRCIAQFPSSW